ncbi:2-hydroxymuconate tautomerase [Lacticigenium naphthae]|uniref:2-hydroxymuconate tautomerase n=1 Tax=Lacticigenium naphthae TaxID=515351 RepID=UPI00040A062A|nr:2-hydroxymuconate tautomerase [Lacticigenium naphthae]
MPYVRIDLLQGRTKEQIQQLMEDVVEAVVKNTNVSKESVHVIVNELQRTHLTKNGEYMG